MSLGDTVFSKNILCHNIKGFVKREIGESLLKMMTAGYKLRKFHRFVLNLPDVSDNILKYELRVEHGTQRKIKSSPAFQGRGVQRQSLWSLSAESEIPSFSEGRT